MDPASPEAGLVEDLACIARSLAGEAGGAGAPAVLWSRPDGMVARLGDVVVKMHAPDTDARDLEARLRLAQSPQLRDVLLPPLAAPPASALAACAGGDAPVELACGGLAVRMRGRLVTAWPAGEPVSPEAPDAAPWEEAATLLARLHAAPLEAAGPIPRAGGPGRVARALGRLRNTGGTPAGRAVEEAFARLPAWARGAATRGPDAGGDPGREGRRDALVHGDWHLGQVVRAPGARAAGAAAPAWRLIDVDDLGAGDPAWDLARPAALYAAGLLPPELWWRFLSAYRAAGGCAVPSDGDPWLALEVPARALVIQSAALAVVAADRDGRPLDEDEVALVDACRRMVQAEALLQV
jgi:hypothetical protein